MPLSEQEQRLLEEMERNLYSNDADFVATVSPRRGKPNYTVVVLGVLLALAGVATLVTGVIVNLQFVGILGFIVMFAGVLVAAAPPRRTDGKASASTVREPRAQRNSSFMDNLNERWDKRQDGRD